MKRECSTADSIRAIGLPPVANLTRLQSSKALVKVARRSLHVSGKELLSLALAIDAAILDGLLEVLAFLGHDYQSLLILAKSANLLT